MNTSALRICHRQMLLKMNFGFRSIQLAKIMIFSTYPRLIYLVSFDFSFIRNGRFLDNLSKILISKVPCRTLDRNLTFFLLDAIFEFWQNIWKRSQKSVVIIQLDPTDSNYFKEQELKNEMTLK